MTPEQHSTIYALVAIAILIVIILAVAIVYHVTAKKAHMQNLKAIDDRYKMPKK
jgi:uncharacterized protein HemX